MTEDSNTLSTPGGRSEGMGAPCLALFETWGYCFWIPQSPSPTRCPSDAERSGGQKESAVQPKATRPDIPPFWPLPNCHPERSEGPAFAGVRTARMWTVAHSSPLLAWVG